MDPQTGLYQIGLTALPRLVATFDEEHPRPLWPNGVILALRKASHVKNGEFSLVSHGQSYTHSCVRISLELKRQQTILSYIHTMAICKYRICIRNVQIELDLLPDNSDVVCKFFHIIRRVAVSLHRNVM